MSFRAGGEFEIVRWVLGWGSAAEVLAPVSLRRATQDELHAALQTAVRVGEIAQWRAEMATNATYLFEYPFKKAHSEHYWTSLLAVFLVRIAQQRTVESFSTWRLRLGGPAWKWKYERSTSLTVAGLTWEDILVEPNLQEFVKHVFKKRFPDRAVIVPDLVIRHKEGETDVTLVEGKTECA